MVELDDLRLIEEARGELRHVHHQNGADGEVGRDYTAEAPLAALCRELRHERIAEAAGADDGTHGVLHRGFGDEGRPREVCEVDDDVGLQFAECDVGV